MPPAALDMAGWRNGKRAGSYAGETGGSSPPPASRKRATNARAVRPKDRDTADHTARAAVAKERKSAMPRIDPLAALIPTVLFVGWSAWAIVAAIRGDWRGFWMPTVGAALCLVTLAVLAREG